MDREVILTEEGYQKLKEEIEHLLHGQAARGRGADQGGARVRRHLRELGVRRRQERAGPARVPDPVARAEAAQRARVDTEHVLHRHGLHRREGDAEGHQEQATREYSIVGSAEADPRTSASQREPGGQGPARQEEGREGHDPRAARRARKLPDHQDPGGRPTADRPQPEGGLPALIGERRREGGGLRGRASTPSRPASRGGGDRRRARGRRGAGAGRETGRARPRRRPPGRAAGPGEDGLPRPRGPQRPHPALGAGGPPRRGRHGRDPRPRPRGHRSAPTAPSRAPAAASSRVAATGSTLLAKALRPPPDKHAGVRDPEIRFRQRYLDLMSDPDARGRVHHPRRRRSRRCAASWTTAGSSRSRPPRCSRSTAAPRRARSDAPQPARPRLLPADRHRALPQAVHRRRAREGLRAGQGLPQRGRQPQAQPRVHDGRDLRGLRGLPGRHGDARAARGGRPGGDRRHDGALEGRRDRLRAAVAAARRSATDPGARAASTSAYRAARRCARAMREKGLDAPDDRRGRSSWTAC